ncbi:hypothetical protein C8Q80DRAFT_1215296 [Daedaleopsis nitida]|nr:hypothetical protein C8Q80DRAFT_1215296 [Daedaleopsis nitida]
MPHHPFRSEDVPYMQAYNQILLENDYQTHQLLCRLAPADSPTFHKFGKKPPADVLDLGCGEGFWVLYAAKHWKSTNTKVTGLDLIDVHNNEVGEVHPHREPEHIPKNVTWTRANFVKYPLPFSDNSFDLVRMANLTLCIPISRWKFVLTQVRRVLRPGGRLELIDDELFFPNVLPRPAKHLPMSSSTRPWQRTPSDKASGMQWSGSLSSPPSPKAPPKIPSSYGSPERPTHKGHARTRSDVESSTNAAIAANVETIFTNMLGNKYGITPRPHVFLLDLLRETFGSDCARETQKLELTVPSRELSENSECIGLGLTASPGSPSVLGHTKRSSEDEKHKAGWLSDKMEKRSWSRAASPTPGAKRVNSRDRRSDDGGLDLKMDPQLAGSLTPKARQLLFGDCEPSTTHASTKGSKPPSWRANAPYQPTGLVLLRPSTLIPFTPGEVEMHACKHMNTLLGCKYALGKYVAGQRGPDGLPLVSDREMDDYLWEYECFRRKRFNWPEDMPGLQFDDEPEEPVSPPPSAKPLNIFNKIAGSASGTSTPPATEPKRTLSTDGLSPGGSPMYGGVEVSRQQSTHVRTIRVWEAVKAHHCAGCHHNAAC